METAAVSSLVHSDQPWTVKVAVDARGLVSICDKLRKLGAIGGEIEVSVKQWYLWLKFRTTGVSIPTLTAENV